MLCVDEKLKEDDKALLLLNSLPPSYEHLVTTIIYGKDTLEFEDVVSMLVSNKIQKRPMKTEESGEACLHHLLRGEVETKIRRRMKIVEEESRKAR